MKPSELVDAMRFPWEFLLVSATATLIVFLIWHFVCRRVCRRADQWWLSAQQVADDAFAVTPMTYEQLITSLGFARHAAMLGMRPSDRLFLSGLFVTATIGIVVVFYLVFIKPLIM